MILRLSYSTAAKVASCRLELKGNKMQTEDIMKLADEYAHCYAFVGDDTMPLKRAELQEAVSKLIHDSKNHECASTLLMYAVDELEAKLRAAADGGCAQEDFES